MRHPQQPVTLRVGIDESLADFCPEIKYVVRTLLRQAGYAYEFVLVGAANDRSLDIYYGPRRDVTARLSIESSGNLFTNSTSVDIHVVAEFNGLLFLDFGGPNEHKGWHTSETSLRFYSDIIFTCYWLLTGARETHYRRDRWDNFNLGGSAFLRHSLLTTPLVSIYARHIRDFFKRLGKEPLSLPWTSTAGNTAFVLSHDVDYPQIIRSIESLRLLKSRGLKSASSIKGIWNGTNHFWKFADWVDFEKQLGSPSAFYFMARKGSLFQYATGTPDGFYDIRAREFTELFRYLKDNGCEVGLHASFNAYKDVEQLRREKNRLEEAAQVEVLGNRHHYWRLDPTAPHETLLKHEQVGLAYDSSLGFEFYPGFRRGVCHPFHVFHPVERRELQVVQLPPAWMDDHFDRRLEVNQIANPEQAAQQLIKTANATSGVVVVDYHPRGMNSDFYPRYGAWFRKFIEEQLESSLTFFRPMDIVSLYREHNDHLDRQSADYTTGSHYEPTLEAVQA